MERVESTELREAVAAPLRSLVRRGVAWCASLLKRVPGLGIAQISVDLLILAFAFELAYLLRFDFSLNAEAIRDRNHQVWYVIALQALSLYLTGINAYIWRYVGLVELKGFVQAALLSMVPVLALRLWAPETLQEYRAPLSIILMDTGLAFGGLLAARVLRRVLYESSEKRRPTGRQATERRFTRTLLLGAGHTGLMAAREIQRHSWRDIEIVGFIDDDRHIRKAVTQGVPILGTTSDLPWLVKKHQIDQVIISIAEVTRREIKRITEICESIPVKVKIIPAMYELLEGTMNVTRIRDVQIEDLLGREPVRLDQDDMRRLLTHRTVLVTGAGGSIGSELARQIARFSPAILLLVERAEFALYNIERELREKWPTLEVVPLIADVGDEERMRMLFSAYEPSIVVHAAAHKHVPLMEINPSEAVKNNVVATDVLARLAGEAGVEVFVLISTDKAVRPRSVMGACKRMAELVIQSHNSQFATRYVAVRFGNVIGSAGSVIPLFHEQIRKGGPVTVTHRDMMRYFMTIPEASQLVLQAAAIGEGGEIFILDMGEPVRILDLALDTIRLSGLRPYEDIDVAFTGLRPGEKLFEELEIKGESITNTRHPKIFIGKIAGLSRAAVLDALEGLAARAKHDQHTEVRSMLNALIPEAELRADQVEPRSSGRPSRPRLLRHSRDRVVTSDLHDAART